MVDFCVRALACLKKEKRKEKKKQLKYGIGLQERIQTLALIQERTWVIPCRLLRQTINHVLTPFSHYSIPKLRQTCAPIPQLIPILLGHLTIR